MDAIERGRRLRAAVAQAVPPTTIKLEAQLYIVDGPLLLRPGVRLVGAPRTGPLNWNFDITEQVYETLRQGIREYLRRLKGGPD